MPGLPFIKMEGAGNDFILLDARVVGERALPGQVARARLCDRRRGIGADGVLVVSVESGDTIRLWYFNADGRGAPLCGNGARCAALYAARSGLTGETLKIRTDAGVLKAAVRAGDVSVEMPVPPAPMRTLCFEDVEMGLQGTFLRVGVPHLVLDVPSVDAVSVESLGKRLRNHPLLAPEGANVNFVQKLAPARLRLRTYERGVETETLACGTGAIAAAWWEQNAAPLFDVEVLVSSGERLRAMRSDSGLELSGPAHEVFRGEYLGVTKPG